MGRCDTILPLKNCGHECTPEKKIMSLRKKVSNAAQDSGMT